MRVLHISYGSPMIELTKALKLKGVQADSCHFDDHPFNFQPDISLKLNTVSRQDRERKKKRFFKESLLKYDIFHFHFGETFFSDKSDLKALIRAGKKLVVHHHGSDIRKLSVARRNNPYVLTKPEWTEEIINKNLSILSKYINHAIVQDYELEEYISKTYKNVHVIPHAIDINQFNPIYPDPKNTVPLVVHAPTKRNLKGTEFILKAIDELKRLGLSFQFKLIEGVTNEEVKNIVRQSDIVIDQLRIGASGYVTSEAMALGKPVICYIREDLVGKYPSGFPVVNANPENIMKVLKDLLENPHQRHELGQKGRKFVELHHHASIVAEKYINIYNSL